MRISDWSSDVCSSDLPPDAVDPMLALDQTRAYWENWISGTCYHGPHRDPVIRSLLTLKALIHTPTGGIRSEEHTSELQSLMRTSYAVFCLKKKISIYL